MAVAQSYYKGHVVTGREEEDLGKICNYLHYLWKNYRTFNTGNSQVTVDDAVTRIKEIISYNIEFVKLMDRYMAEEEPSFAKKLTLHYVSGGKNSGKVHCDVPKVARYLLYLKQTGETLTFEDGSNMPVLIAVERVRETLSYDAGHLDLFNQVYNSKSNGNKNLYGILDKPQLPKKIAFSSNKIPIGSWGNGQEATPDELSKAADWGYNLKGAQFVVIDTDNEEARAKFILKYPKIEETLKTINSNKKGSCHYWLTTKHRLPRKQYGGYDLLGNAVNSATHEKDRLYMLGNNQIENIDTVLKTPEVLKSVYEVFGNDNPNEVISRIEAIKQGTIDEQKRVVYCGHF